MIKRVLNWIKNGESDEDSGGRIMPVHTILATSTFFSLGVVIISWWKPCFHASMTLYCFGDNVSPS